MREFLSKYRVYRFFAYWLATWVEYWQRLQIYDEFENANYHRKKLFLKLKANDYEKM